MAARCSGRPAQRTARGEGVTGAPGHERGRTALPDGRRAGPASWARPRRPRRVRGSHRGRPRHRLRRLLQRLEPGSRGGPPSLGVVAGGRDRRRQAGSGAPRTQPLHQRQRDGAHPRCRRLLADVFRVRQRPLADRSRGSPSLDGPWAPQPDPCGTRGKQLGLLAPQPRPDHQGRDGASGGFSSAPTAAASPPAAPSRPFCRTASPATTPDIAFAASAVEDDGGLWLYYSVSDKNLFRVRLDER